MAIYVLRGDASCEKSELSIAADLHQIIKSGQHLTAEHVQYFLYQILRGKNCNYTPCVSIYI